MDHKAELERLYELMLDGGFEPQALEQGLLEDLDWVARCESNRAGVRLLLSAVLAKHLEPNLNATQPYTEIEGIGSFSGRTLDERVVGPFLASKKLPTNSTTAFLTPALRNISAPLGRDIELVGSPKGLYSRAVRVLNDVQDGLADSGSVLVAILHALEQMRIDNENRLNALLSKVDKSPDAIGLPSEAIVNLLRQHLACKNSSRLPVLIVAAVYEAISEGFPERVRTLNAHNAADLQTGALGDVEVWIETETNLVTVYEMKAKAVSDEDINIAVKKIIASKSRVDNYLFVTTEPIDSQVAERASELYADLGGTEIAILDCIEFARHFLHLFHRYRGTFLDSYQKLVLGEPDSAVSTNLKQAFLALRLAAE